MATSATLSGRQMEPPSRVLGRKLDSIPFSSYHALIIARFFSQVRDLLGGLLLHVQQIRGHVGAKRVDFAPQFRFGLVQFGVDPGCVVTEAAKQLQN